MKKPEIWRLVLARLLPARAEFTRDDWRSYIQRYLLPEIQTEILRFYGENTSAEALHPGLDYASRGHRARLQVFPRHAQLFVVFDDLRLTESEIYILCKWEGTKLAKEHFERQHKTKVRDTTWDGMKPYNKQPPCGHLTPQHVVSQRGSAAQEKPDDEQVSQSEAELDDELMEDSDDLEDLEESEQESDDEPQQSYGVELNQRLIDGRMDADWEQWMKEAIERGDVPGSLDSSHSQAFQSLARLHTQNRARFVRAVGSTSQSPVSYRPVAQNVSTRTPGPQMTSVSRDSVNSGIDPSAQANEGSNPTTRTSPTYWGREIPEIFSDSPRPHIAALQAQLPPPPQYLQFYPATGVASAPVAGSAQTALSAAPSTIVPS